MKEKEFEIENVLKYNNKNFVSICARIYIILAIIIYIYIIFGGSDSMNIGIFCCIVFIFGAITMEGIILPFRIKTNKVVKKYGYNELKKELLSEKTIKVNGINTYLTENFIISNNNVRGVEIIKYNEIGWIYPTKIGYYGPGPTAHIVVHAAQAIIAGTPLRAHLKNGKIVVLAYPKRIADMEFIFNKIYTENKEVLFGYSAENKDKFDKLFPMNKTKDIIIYVIIFILLILGIIVASKLNT